MDRPAETLAALRMAADAGVLTSGVLDAAAADARRRKPLSMKMLSDLQPLARLAETLEREGYPEPRAVLGIRVGPERGPLLVVLVAALFRHAAESAPDLFLAT